MLNSKQTSPESHPKKYLAIIIISIIAIGAIGSVYYISNQDNSTESGITINSHRTSNPNNLATTNSNSIANSNTNAITNTPVITTTSNWLTYANSKFNYTIKYPDGWSDENTADANPAMFADPIAVAQTIETSLLQGSKIEIVVDQNTSTSIQDFAAGQEIDSDILSQAEIPVADTTGLWRAVNGPLGYYHIVYVKNASSIYRIIQSIPKVEDRGKYTAIYDQVLLNFAFTK